MAEGPQGAVGGAWRQDAEKWLNGGGAGRSRGVLAESVALQPPEVAQRRRFQRQGVRKHPAPEGALRRAVALLVEVEVKVRKHPAPEGALRPPCRRPERPSAILSESTQAPEGALRHKDIGEPRFKDGSESTPHQKVH